MPPQIVIAPPLQTAAACEAHRAHRPEPAYREEHHVIPQAWQHVWRPGDPSPLGSRTLTPIHPSLFDPRTVSICRTGHGNVHVWIVRFMKEWERGDHASPVGHHPNLVDVKRAVVEKSKADGEHFRVVHELEIAMLALSRWTAANGDLRVLCDARMYGEI